MRLIQYGPDNDRAGGLKRTVIADSETQDVLKAVAEKIADQHALTEAVWSRLQAEMHTGQ